MLNLCKQTLAYWDIFSVVLVKPFSLYEVEFMIGGIRQNHGK